MDDVVPVRRTSSRDVSDDIRFIPSLLSSDPV